MTNDSKPPIPTLSISALVEGQEYRTIYDHQPFQESADAELNLDNPNPCKDGRNCNREMAEANQGKCRRDKKPGRTARPRARPLSQGFGKRKRYHVSLGKVESREDIFYNVEIPARAAHRIQYLTLTTRVKLNDADYTDMLYRKLIEEEEKQWDRTVEMRENGERERIKALVLKGKTAPPADMPDLYHHPVFKVTALLKQLDSYDRVMNLGPAVKEGITPVEPYEFDGDKFFQELHKSGLYWVPSIEQAAAEDRLKGKLERAKIRRKIEKLKDEEQAKLEVLYARKSHQSDDDDEEEEDGEEFQKPPPSSSAKTFHTVSVLSVKAEEISAGVANIRKERELKERKLLKKLERMKRKDTIRLKSALDRQKERDRVYLEATELERQYYRQKHYDRIARGTLPKDCAVRNGDKLLERPSMASIEISKIAIQERFKLPQTPPDVEETESFRNLRTCFDLRGGDHFDQFRPEENEMIQTYIDLKKKVDEILYGGERIAQMHEKEQVAADEFLIEQNKVFRLF